MNWISPTTKRSVQTSNHYLRAIKGFTTWLVSNEKLNRDPLVSLSMLNVKTDRRHDRRPLSEEEFSRLIKIAEVGPPIAGITGPDRAMHYILAAWTGLRRGEIGSLTFRSFHFSAKPPTVTVEASHSKHRCEDVLVLHPDLVKRLRQWITDRGFSPDEILFPISKNTCGVNRKTSKIMKYDLSAARMVWVSEAKTKKEYQRREASCFLQYQDAKGKYADFHGLRHTFITNLGKADVSPKTAQALARQSDIRLTMNVYTHVGQAEQAEAIGQLPGLE